MPELEVELEHESVEPQQYLTFMQGGALYGLAIRDIKEIIEYCDITEIPMTPAFISGVMNLRGCVVPVIDLNQRFSGKLTKVGKRTSIIVLDVKDDDLRIQIGVTVDMVNEVLVIPQADIEPAPKLGRQVETNFICGMAKINEKLLILLDITHVMSVDELSLVGNIQSTILEDM